MNIPNSSNNSYKPRLKCDREEPCSNCTTRNFECTYVSHGRNRGRGQRREKDHQLGARISHLERLISNLAARSSETGEVLLSDSELQRGRDRRTSSSGSNSSFPKQAAHTNATLVASFENRPGQIISNTSQTIYVSDTHWAAICSEVRPYYLTISFRLCCVCLHVLGSRDQRTSRPR